MPPISVRSRRAADARLDALRARFGELPLETMTVENDPDFFEDGVDLFDAGVRGGAAAWVFDDDGRVLLLRDPREPDRWTIPGGGHEPGESLPETAEREVWEEAGVDATVTDVWRVRRKRFVCAGDPERRGYLLESWFDARYDGGDAGLYPERWDDEESVLAVEWFARPPDALSDAAARRAATWDWPDP